MEEQVGKVIHYYGKIGVGVVRLEKDLKVGDTIHLRGKTVDSEQMVESMQVDHQDVNAGKKGDEVAIKFGGQAKEGDTIFRKS